MTSTSARKKDFRRVIPRGMQAVEVSPETGLLALQRLPVIPATEADLNREIATRRLAAAMVNMVRHGRS